MLLILLLTTCSLLAAAYPAADCSSAISSLNSCVDRNSMSCSCLDGYSPYDLDDFFEEAFDDYPSSCSHAHQVICNEYFDLNLDCCCKSQMLTLIGCWGNSLLEDDGSSMRCSTPSCSSSGGSGGGSFQNNNNNNSSSSDGLSGGAIAGIVIAILFVVGAIVAGIVVFVVCRKRNESTDMVAPAQAKIVDMEKGKGHPSAKDSAKVSTVIDHKPDGSVVVTKTTKFGNGSVEKTVIQYADKQGAQLDGY